MHNDLMSSEEAADELGVSLSTISRMARDGRLPEAIKGSGLRQPRFFHRKDVMALVTESKATA